mmetsp:Transcript_25596/g.36714  ORF Transcript_25596/g.36714 Transcript_25596/m.36714 type:complete len:310 (-) Transcript_25596:1787-2716(-)
MSSSASVLPTQIPESTEASSVTSSVSSATPSMSSAGRRGRKNKCDDDGQKKRKKIRGKNPSDIDFMEERKHEEGELKKTPHATLTSTTSRGSSDYSESQVEAFTSHSTDLGSSSNNNDDHHDTKLQKMASACRTILECIGEDPDREGLLQTPTRWAKALLFMTKGYCQSVQTVTNGAVFEEHHKEMVVVRDINIHSLCEHHMVPFSGKVHVGYIPNGKILGLSKIARIADVFARRLQVQERLTREIADAIVEAVSPLGVAVVVECQHFCMVMRGVEKCGSQTYTSCFRGLFEEDSQRRSEFFSVIHRQK